MSTNIDLHLLIRAADKSRHGLQPGETQAWFHEKRGMVRMSKPGIFHSSAWEEIAVSHNKNVAVPKFDVEGTDPITRNKFTVKVDCVEKLPEKPEQIAKFAKQLGLGSGSDGQFKTQVRDFIRNELESDHELLTNIGENRETLEEKCQSWINDTFGLEGRVYLSDGELNLTLSRTIALSCRAQDSTFKLTPTLTINVEGWTAGDEEKKVTRPMTPEDLDRMMIQKVGDFMRRHVKLHEYYFGSTERVWRKELQDSVEAELKDRGWGIVLFRLEDEIPPRADDKIEQVNTTVKYTPPNYGSEIEIDCTARVSVDNMASYLEAGNVHEVQDRVKHAFWFSNTADRIVKDVRFEQSYTDLLVNWSTTEEQIRDRIRDEAQNDGLSAGTIITRPELPAINLLYGARYLITCQESDDDLPDVKTARQPKGYETSEQGTRVSFDLDLSIQVRNLDEIRELLDRKKENIEDYLLEQVMSKARDYTRGRSPKNYYLEFVDVVLPEAPTDEGVIDQETEHTRRQKERFFKPGLQSVINKLLTAELAATKCDVDVIQRKDGVVEIFDELRSHPSIELPAQVRPRVRRDHDADDAMYAEEIDFSFRVRIVGVDDNRWGLFQSYNWAEAERALRRKREAELGRYDRAIKENEIFNSDEKRARNFDTRGDYDSIERRIEESRRKLYGLVVDDPDRAVIENREPRLGNIAENRELVVGGVAQTSIPKAEIISVRVREGLQAKLDTAPPEVLVYAGERHRVDLTSTINVLANEASTEEFGLNVEITEFKREDTLSEELDVAERQEELRIKQREQELARESKLLDIHAESQKRRMRYGSEIERAGLLQERRDNILKTVDADLESEDFKRTEEEIDKTLNSRPAEREGMAELHEERRQRLLEQLRKAHQALDELPEGDEGRAQLESEIERKSEEYEKTYNEQKSDNSSRMVVRAKPADRQSRQAEVDAWLSRGKKQDQDE